MLTVGTLTLSETEFSGFSVREVFTQFDSHWSHVLGVSSGVRMELLFWRAWPSRLRAKRNKELRAEDGVHTVLISLAVHLRCKAIFCSEEGKCLQLGSLNLNTTKNKLREMCNLQFCRFQSIRPEGLIGWPFFKTATHKIARTGAARVDFWSI